MREGARTELEPDSLVHSTRSHAAARVVEGPGQLVLAVEITSPSTAHIDRYRKRALYQRHGVPDYWIAFPASRFLERWRPADTEPLILGATLTWQPLADRAPKVVDLVRYLEAVHGA